MTEITDVLNRIPRQMILILKTNDLLRGIDSRLKTAATSRSFVTMSKCCIRAVKEHDLKQCDNWTCLCKVHFQAVVDYTRIALYQFSLTRLGDRLLMVWGVVSNNFRYVYSLLTGRQNNNMALALA